MDTGYTEEKTFPVVSCGRERLDLFLRNCLKKYSRSRVQEMFAGGAVSVNGREAKQSYRVRRGDVITVRIPAARKSEVLPEDIKLDIIYEDADIVAVNKTPGMIVHPAGRITSGTLVNALLYHCRDLRGIGGVLRPGIVHRLDKGTSGVIVTAKTQDALTRLQKQFKKRQVYKEYNAIVIGIPSEEKFHIDCSIGRDLSDRKKFSTKSVKLREAHTEVVLIKTAGELSLLSVRPKTGRTHQIRVHLSTVGLPILGDDTYGGRAVRRYGDLIGRPALHALILRVRHPVTNEEMEFRAPLPGDMIAALDAATHI